MSTMNRNAANLPERPMQRNDPRTHSIDACPRCGGPITTALAKKLVEKVPNDLEGRTPAELIAETLIKKAIEGDLGSAKEIADRIEGKATEAPRVKLNGPVEFVVVYETGLLRDQEGRIHPVQAHTADIKSTE